MAKQTEKTFQYLGKKYKYTTPASLGKKLKLSTNEAKKLIDKSKKGTMFAYLTDKEGNVARQNLKLKPLVARNFGLKRINNKTITKDNFTNYKGITISSRLNKSRPINLAITITADIRWSEDFERKKFQINKFVSPNQINNQYLESVIREHYGLTPVEDVVIVDTDFNSAKTEALKKQIFQRFNPDSESVFNQLPLNTRKKIIQSLEFAFVDWNKEDTDVQYIAGTTKYIQTKWKEYYEPVRQRENRRRLELKRVQENLEAEANAPKTQEDLDDIQKIIEETKKQLIANRKG